MGKLYENLILLCERKGVSGYRFCRDIGMQPSTLTDLRSGRQHGINATNAEKAASYFGITVAQLLSDDPLAAVPEEDGEDLSEYLAMLKDRPECRQLFQLTRNASKADVERAVAIITALRGQEE